MEPTTGLTLKLSTQSDADITSDRSNVMSASSNVMNGSWLTESQTFDDATIADLFLDVTLGVVMVACCLITVVGNAMVLHAVKTDRKLQTVCRIVFFLYHSYFVLENTIKAKETKIGISQQPERGRTHEQPSLSPTSK